MSRNWSWTQLLCWVKHLVRTDLHRRWFSHCPADLGETINQPCLLHLSFLSRSVSFSSLCCCLFQCWYVFFDFSYEFHLCVSHDSSCFAEVKVLIYKPRYTALIKHPVSSRWILSVPVYSVPNIFLYYFLFNSLKYYSLPAAFPIPQTSPREN